MKSWHKCATGLDSIGRHRPACHPHCHHAPDQGAGKDEDKIRFPSEAFAQLANLEASHFWFRARARLICWALGRYFPEAKNFLEIGCGTGFVLSEIGKAFPQIFLTGSDALGEGLVFARERNGRAEILQFGAETIPFENEFDVIGAFDVLEHIADDARVLREMYQAASPHGGVIITVPQHPWLWSGVDEYAGHQRRYSAALLKKIVSSAGFEIVRVTSFVSLILPVMAFSRVVMRRRGQARTGADELKMNPVVNRVLERILAVERSAIRSGMDLPAGGSLLLIARKGGL